MNLSANEVIDKFLKRFKSWDELTQDEQEEKFMGVLTNGLPNYPKIVRVSSAYYNNIPQHKNQLGDPFTLAPTVPKNKKWYDTFRKGYSNV